MSPSEVAGAVLFLAGDNASFTTGGLLLVDGGWTAMEPAAAKLSAREQR